MCSVELLVFISISCQDVFYSRKNFKRPDLQMSPHQAFEQEVALLDTFFKGTCNPICVCFLILSPFCEGGCLDTIKN